ncbi:MULTISPECIES: SIMPL domain-containing protein [Catenuloplanes]|uniref:Uncharacterized protein YggE n=1 Tax=Catenuloplanes niger TaxID=587534 RepID=A0AAE4CV81_9ACTN|nr:SIMPL domain-containing protein [Catenuloplanes niger]MDR7327056.1 uncharacterized protein YggE [Catenuloplanes niger]
MRNFRAALPVRVVLATLVVLPLSLFGGRPAAAASDPAASQAREGVVVSGTGEVFGEPDLLVATFAAEAGAPTVSEAMDGAGAGITRMRDALVRAGVARADLQTSDVTLRARENEDKKITGYTAHQGLTATVRDVPRAGTIMSATIAAGGDAARLHGVTFAIENRSALLVRAREKAFADARGKAELYARQAGRSLGRVVRVSEESSGYHGGSADYSLSADAAVPVEPGRQPVSVTVVVEWAFPPATGTLR